MRVFTLVLAAASLVACSPDRGGGQETQGLSDSDSATGATDSLSGGTGEKFDLGGNSASASDTAAETTAGDICRKIDVIMAVDNSGSMQEEIADLRGPVFNSLPQQLLAVGNGIDDFHLAVVDACPKPANYHDTGKIGACNFSTGNNWMISSSPDLTAEFECVSNLSFNGYMGGPDLCEDAGDLKDDDEQPALTAATSVTPGQIAGPNADFLRDDALLFVVAITDEDEELLGTSVDEITQTLVDAKGGVENIVFLGIGGASDCNGPYGTAIPANNLQQVTAFFENAQRGVFWDLCQGDLEGAFAAIITSLNQACNEFVPPG